MSATAGLNESVLIPDLLRAEPLARHVLDRYGLHGCGACRLYGQDVRQLVEALNAQREERQHGRRPLPVWTSN